MDTAPIKLGITMSETIQDDMTFCAVHPDRETSLRCNKCERLMCSQCAVQTPVGYRCRECINQIQAGFYNANQADMIITFAVTAVLTGIGGVIVAAVNVWILFVIIIGFPFGGFVAEMAMRLTKRKRARNSAVIAAGGAVVGGFAGAFIHQYITVSNLIEQITRTGRQVNVSAFELAAQSLFNDFGLLIFIGIVAFAVYGRYRMRS
jgi:hypothetical protein